MRGPVAPPARAERLLRRALGEGTSARSILGDLRQEHATIAGARGAAAANRWYWRQALAIGLRYRLERRRPASLLDDLRMDTRFAVRTMWSRPVFTVTVLATLALGIGSNSAMVGLVHRMLLASPPHLQDPDSLAYVNLQVDWPDGTTWTMSTTSYPVYASLRDARKLLAGVAAVARGEALVGPVDDPVPWRAAKVSGEYFDVLGVRAARGRLIAPEDDRLPSGTPVAVLSHEIWQARSAVGDDVLGEQIVIDGLPFTVVGVAPPGFTGDSMEAVDVWMPLAAGMVGEPGGWWNERYRLLVQLVVRLAPGASVEAASAEAAAVLEREGDPEAPRVVLGPLQAGRGVEGITELARVSILLALVAGAVLALAIANVTGLLLVRASRRGHEMEVRAALGMWRGRQLRQLLTEGLLLASCGGAISLLVARWIGDWARAMLFPGAAPGTGGVEPTVLLTSLAAVLGAAVVGGLAPALARDAGAPHVQGHRRGGRLRAALLVTQVALSTVLLCGAGVFGLSLHRARNQDFGFDVDAVRLVTANFAPGTPDAVIDATYLAAVDRLAALPGVLASPTLTVPFGPRIALPMSAEGADSFPAPDRQLPYLNPVTSVSLDVLGIRVIQGRGIEPADEAPGAPLVVLVSERMARTIWPGGSALGRCVRSGILPGEPPTPRASDRLPCREVIGVVEDSRRASIRPDERVMQYYLPFGQLPHTMGPPMPFNGMFVRGEAATASMVRAAILESGATVLRVRIERLAEIIAPQMRPWETGTAFLGVLGGLALLMAAVGLNGSLAQAYEARRREIGVRIALGASRPRVATLVLGGALRVAVVGTMIGVGAVLVVGPWVASFLFGTAAWDAMVIALTCTTLLATAAIAAAAPALRATRTDPVDALRAD